MRPQPFSQTLCMHSRGGWSSRPCQAQLPARRGKREASDLGSEPTLTFQWSPAPAPSLSWKKAKCSRVGEIRDGARETQCQGVFWAERLQIEKKSWVQKLDCVPAWKHLPRFCISGYLMGETEWGLVASLLLERGASVTSSRLLWTISSLLCGVKQKHFLQWSRKLQNTLAVATALNGKDRQ